MPPSPCALDLESVRGIIGGERGEEEEEEAPALVLAVSGRCVLDGGECCEREGEGIVEAALL